MQRLVYLPQSCEACGAARAVCTRIRLGIALRLRSEEAEALAMLPWLASLASGQVEKASSPSWHCWVSLNVVRAQEL